MNLQSLSTDYAKHIQLIKPTPHPEQKGNGTGHRIHIIAAFFFFTYPWAMAKATA